jgi:hypothetical protein
MAEVSPIGDNSQMPPLNTEPIPGQNDRFETSESLNEFLQDKGGGILGIAALLASGIIGFVYFQAKYEFDPSILRAVVVRLPVAAVCSWWFVYRRYSRPGFIQITNDAILWNNEGVDRTYHFSSLRDVELPDKKEIGYGADYIYLYFGDGESVELEKWIPHFPEIKHAIMRSIAKHPDLEFLRLRLSKAAVGSR